MQDSQKVPIWIVQPVDQYEAIFGTKNRLKQDFSRHVMSTAKTYKVHSK